MRPPLEIESKGDDKSIVSVSSDVMLVFDPADDVKSHISGATPATQARAPRRPGTAEKLNKAFVFDRVFDEASTQEDVFNLTVKPLVKHAISGYNATVLAYGATGAGKTFTMMGTQENPGIMSRALDELYTLIDEDLDYSHSLLISMLEIYNEEVRDLLLPKSQQKKLNIRDHKTLGPHVPGLSEVTPTSIEHAKTTLEKGINNRVMAATGANTESSRSHALFSIRIHSTPRNAGVNANERIAMFTLIDLAGSERVSRTSNTGLRLVEGSNINKSLLALGSCINILCKTAASHPDKAVRVHVPYRDSKLTYLLKNSLGGNCKTLMISNISPSRVCYEDTLNTLQYANRAKNIKCSVQRNEMSVIYNISQYRKIIERVTAENTKLKEQLLSVRNGKAVAEIDRSLILRKEKILPQYRDAMNTATDIELRIKKLDCYIANPEIFAEEDSPKSPISQPELQRKISGWKQTKLQLSKSHSDQEARVKLLTKELDKIKTDLKTVTNKEAALKLSTEIEISELKTSLNCQEKVIEYNNWHTKFMSSSALEHNGELLSLVNQLISTNKINPEIVSKIKKITAKNNETASKTVAKSTQIRASEKPVKLLPKKSVSFAENSVSLPIQTPSSPENKLPELSVKLEQKAPLKSITMKTLTENNEKDWDTISQKFSALQSNK